MSGEEAAGPPGPKALRLLYFVGAGCNQFLIFPFILHILIHIFRSNEIAVVCVFFMKLFLLSVVCTAAINKWRELERKAVLKKEQQLPPTPNSPDTVQKAVD